jgi:DNA-binding transcriptional LysR family regulator
MLPNLHRMAIFAKVVELNSFSAAAAELGLGKSVISHHVRALEAHAGAQLLNRSTRSLALTEQGRHFYDCCQQMLVAANGAFTDIDTSLVDPRGTIRITAPYNLGVAFLCRCLGAFNELYPKVSFDLILEDSILNIIEEGFDLALRVGWLSDSRAHAVKLAPFSMVPCATPALLRRQLTPKAPEDLSELRWVSITQLPHPQRVILENRNGRRRTVKLTPAIRTNTGIAARQLVLDGSYAGLLPDYSVKREIASRELVRLLPDWHTRQGAISAVYPRREHLPAKTRLLIDFLKSEFRKQFG